MQQVEPQEILSRKKRDFQPRSRWNYHSDSERQRTESSSSQNKNERAPRDPHIVNQFDVPFNDAKWAQQWYLKKKSNQKLSMRVEDAWAAGFTGKDITVTVLDDGVEKDHPDLKANYNRFASSDINDDDDDPSPAYDKNNENKHGTRCAG